MISTQLFFTGSGQSVTSLQHQTAAVLIAVAGVSCSATHHVLDLLVVDLHHKTVECIFKSLDVACRFVEKKEEDIVCGSGSGSVRRAALHEREQLDASHRRGIKSEEWHANHRQVLGAPSTDFEVHRTQAG